MLNITNEIIKIPTLWRSVINLTYILHLIAQVWITLAVSLPGYQLVNVNIAYMHWHDYCVAYMYFKQVYSIAVQPLDLLQELYLSIIWCSTTAEKILIHWDTCTTHSLNNSMYIIDYYLLGWYGMSKEMSYWYCMLLLCKQHYGMACCCCVNNYGWECINSGLDYWNDRLGRVCTCFHHVILYVLWI